MPGSSGGARPCAWQFSLIPTVIPILCLRPSAGCSRIYWSIWATTYVTAACWASEFPSIPLYAVPGNCDFASREQDTLEFYAGPVKVFATHGHRYYVKSTMDSLLNAAHFSGAQLVLYGHTHIARIEYPAGMTVVNPGSSGLGSEPSFAVIDISDSGGIAAQDPAHDAKGQVHMK